MSSSSQDEEDPYAQRGYAEYYSRSASDEHGASSTATSAPTPSSSTSSSSSSSRRETSRAQASSRQRQGPFVVPASTVTSLDDDAEEEQNDSVSMSAARNEEEHADEEPLFGVSDAESSRRGRRTGEGAQHDEQTDARNVDEEEEDDDTDSFYALLNIQRDASEEQIRDAYRALAVSLHPDKHTSPSLKMAAENRFRAVQRAYEVLSDAEKRSVYDHFGVRGLSRNWSLVRRSNNGGPRTAAEMREEFERLARQRKAEEMDNMVRSKGEFVINVDASSVFCPDEQVPRSKAVLRQIGHAIAKKEQETGKSFQQGDTLEIELPDVTLAERWNRVGFTSLVGKHGWEVPLTMFTRLVVNGQMASKGGMGGGNLTGTLKTHWNARFNSEASLSLLQPRIGSVRGQYELTKFSFLSFMATGSSFLMPPQLHISLGQRLSESSALTGFTTFNSGTYTLGAWGKDVRVRRQSPNMSFGMSNRYGDGKGWTWQVGLGIDNQSTSVEYAFRPVLLGSPKVRVGLTLGIASGLNAFHSVERKITENVKLGVGLFFGIPMGSVTLQLRFTRLGQKLLVPIQLSPTYRPDLVAACTFLPGVGLLAAEHFVFRPSRRRKVQNKLVDLRAQHKELIQQRRKAAREAIDVLRQNAFKRAHVERNTGGLVVIQAYYGKRSSWPDLCDDEAAPDDVFRDVWGASVDDGLRNGSARAHEQTPTGSIGEEEDQGAWCDVTVAVMMLVQRGQLLIPGGRQKHKLLGFYDPCMGERKHLVVRYLFRERLHHVVVDDVTQLTAPLRSHTL